MKHRLLLQTIGNVGHSPWGSPHRRPRGRLSPIWLRVIAGVSLTLGPNLLWHSDSLASSRAEQFLAALREANYHDTALVYLERIQDSPSIDDEFRDRLLFEQAISLVAEARQQPDYTRRDTQLQAALEKFSEFAKQHPDHARATTATSQQGQLRLERARIRVHQGATAKTDDERRDFLTGAGNLFTEARQALLSQKRQIKSQLLEMRELPADQQDSETQTALRAEYVQTLMSAALAQYELAVLETTDEEDREKQLTEASESFGDISIKYSGTLASLYALLYQGKCYQELGEFKKGLELFRELQEIEDVRDVAVQRLQLMALKQSLDSWTEVGQWDTAIEAGQSRLGRIRSSMQSHSEWHEVRLALARAYQAKARNNPKEHPERSLGKARELVSLVARHPGPLQRESRQLLSELGGRSKSDSAPRSFDEARQQGQQALEEMQSAIALIQLAVPKLASTKDAQRQSELEEEITSATANRDHNRQLALSRMHQAIGLAKPDTPVNDLNAVRYYLAFLYYDSEDYYQAAVLADFLATKYPANPAAKHCANIARAAYINIYTHGNESDKRFAAARFERLVDRLIDTWPDASEAGEAVMTLVNVMIQQGDLAKARSYLARIPKTSVFRTQAELRTGQALWSAYLRGARERRAASSSEDQLAMAPDLEELRATAQEMLDHGIQQARQGGVTPNLLRATLALAQISVDTHQFARAIELLEDPTIGPLTFVQRKSAEDNVPGLAAESYKTGLRAYIANLPNAPNADQAIARATQIMEGLKESFSKDPDGQQRLIAIYLGLASDLKDQIQIAPPKTKASLAGSFELFLDQVLAESSDFNVLNWVAETFAGLGDSYQGRHDKLTPTAKKYLERAVATYQTIIQNRQPLQLDDAQLRQVRMRLATTLRKVQDYPASIQMLATILREKNSMLDVQIEAAGTYQEGAVKGDKTMYDRAVFGGEPGGGGKNIIWGWARIAKIAAQQMYRGPEAKEKFRGIFHEARYNTARIRYEQAMRSQGDQRTELLKRAERGIRGTQGLYPQMGGPTWKPKYDELMKKIQRAMGREPQGLSAAEMKS